MNKKTKLRRTDPKLMEAVAHRLKIMRAERGYSQEYVQENTGLNVPRYESGKVNVSLVTLTVFCKFYRLSLEEFFKGIVYSQD